MDPRDHFRAETHGVYINATRTWNSDGSADVLIFSQHPAEIDLADVPSSLWTPERISGLTDRDVEGIFDLFPNLDDARNVGKGPDPFGLSVLEFRSHERNGIQYHVVLRRYPSEDQLGKCIDVLMGTHDMKVKVLNYDDFPVFVFLEQPLRHNTYVLSSDLAFFVDDFHTHLRGKLSRFREFREHLAKHLLSTLNRVLADRGPKALSKIGALSETVPAEDLLIKAANRWESDGYMTYVHRLSEKLAHSEGRDAHPYEYSAIAEAALSTGDSTRGEILVPTTEAELIKIGRDIFARCQIIDAAFLEFEQRTPIRDHRRTRPRTLKSVLADSITTPS